MSPFALRAQALARGYVDASPKPGEPAAEMVWDATVRSLGALRSVLGASPHALEEQQLLEDYAQAHVALLDALRAPSGDPR